MTRTFTRTSTRTYTRVRSRLIEVQFISFAQRFGYRRWEELSGVIRERLISGLLVYASNAAGETLASVELSLNWLAHDELRETTEVVIDERWQNDVSPQVQLYADNFEEFVKEQSLTLDRRIRLTDACREDALLYKSTMRRLGLVRGTEVNWRASPVGTSERVRGLAELSTGVQYADDED